MTQVELLIQQQLEFYAKKAEETEGTESEFWVQQGFDLLRDYKAETEDEGLFTCTYFRYESESFGVTFEVEHGDPELMFGGIVDAQSWVSECYPQTQK